MTRRSALWVLFAVSGGLFLVLGAVDARLWDEGGPGIVGFEIAFERDEADRILAEWGPDGRDAARLSLWIDFVFLAAYGAFWALAAHPARVWPLAIAAAGFDALENVALLVELGGARGAAWPVLAGAFATVKFVALAVVVGYVAVRLVRRFPRVALGLAACVVVALAVNTWLVEREIRSAEPDAGGHVLELPAGDIHVRVEGPADAPPVVLLHGFGASMRWWAGVAPRLRGLRVVRLDLLGHGGSEKPRQGYSMENQAEVVAQALRALGIRRAPVVGHSMGGIVATALVERHREMVERVMMIGTPADGDTEGDLLARAAFWPVVGHANDRLVSERTVRWVVEQGFAPGFDAPGELSRDIFERTTFNAFRDSGRAAGDYWDERPLDERLAGAGLPLTVLLGEEEGHTRESVRRFNRVPGARTVVLEGLDHSPQVESPGRTAPLIEAFALGR